MLKSYLRYDLQSTFGVICSPNSSISLVSNHDTSLIACPAYTDILIWYNRKGILHSILQHGRNETEITCMATTLSSSTTNNHNNQTRNHSLIACGRFNGSVDVWELDISTTATTITTLATKSSSSSSSNTNIINIIKPKSSFSGHYAQVSCMIFSPNGSRLITGSRDTFIIVWDPVAEVALFRLKGHKDEITSVSFLTSPSSQLPTTSTLSSTYLLSSCKDSMLKIWDLESQRCINTIVEHSSPVWVAAPCPIIITTNNNTNTQTIATGCSDGLLRTLTFNVETGMMKLRNGSLGRQTTERVETMCFSREGDVLVIQSAGRVIEFYRVRDFNETNKKRKRRIRRSGVAGNSSNNSDPNDDLWTQDEIEFAISFRVPHRARSIVIGPRKHHNTGSESSITREVIISFKNNLVHTYQLVQKLEQTNNRDDDDDDEEGEEESNNNNNNPTPKRQRKSSKTNKIKYISSIQFVSALELQGHRTDIRSVSLSEAEDLFVTAADGAVKIWNVESGACIRTMPSGTCLCCLFLPGDLYCVVGTRDGALFIFELASGNIVLEVLNAHGTNSNDGSEKGNAINSLDLRSDKRTLLTSSSDQTCKFWDIRTSNNTTDKKKQQQLLTHTRTLKVGDDVQCGKYTKSKSMDKIKIMVALLDNTVKIFHDDSLEFHISLYGHKLPVLTIDSSYDDELIVTGSTDKTIKIWGLDFGDCHRSLFAHEGSVTMVKFASHTHYVFSCGKDGRIRYWDCDRFQQIMSFDNAHLGDIWSLCISHDASFFLSVGKDKAIHVWNRSREMVFAEEQQEIELEKMLNKQDVDELKGRSLGDVIPALALSSTTTTTMTGQTDEEMVVASSATKSRTLEGLEASERLMEALNINTEDDNVESFIALLRQMRPQDIEEAAILWPFALVHSLLSRLHQALQQRLEIEICCKLVLRLIKIHFTTIASNSDTYKDLISNLKTEMRNALHELHQRMGVNLAAVRRIKVVGVQSIVGNNNNSSNSIMMTNNNDDNEMDIV
jgi:U3 small nucleolar RNA-associated protein 12